MYRFSDVRVCLVDDSNGVSMSSLSKKYVCGCVCVCVGGGGGGCPGRWARRMFFAVIISVVDIFRFFVVVVFKIQCVCLSL